MFNTYEEAANYIKSERSYIHCAKRSRDPRHSTYDSYIMKRNGKYNVAWSNEEKDYAESNGWELADKLIKLKPIFETAQFFLKHQLVIYGHDRKNGKSNAVLISEREYQQVLENTDDPIYVSYIKSLLK